MHARTVIESPPPLLSQAHCGRLAANPLLLAASEITRDRLRKLVMLEYIGGNCGEIDSNELEFVLEQEQQGESQIILPQVLI